MLRSLAATAASASLLIIALAIAGCRTTPEPAKPQEFTEPPVPADGPAGPTVELQAVYFDYDSAMLRDDARATLKKDAEVLRATPNAVVTLEGHCDERGSEEYNLALGERRA